MIAVDTNILVHAHRADSPHHDAAHEALASLAASRRRLAVPWPCVHEFLATVTHPRILRPPSGVVQAMAAVRGLVEQPTVSLLGETADHLTILEQLLSQSGATGPKVHDARVAAVCLGHGVDELWTADRDFSYFPALRTHNPLVR